MAQEHDLFDDIIDISKGFNALKNPFGDVTAAFVGATDPNAPQWNPADYKEKPRGNTIPCMRCISEKSGCTACMDACPVNAIEIDDGSIEIKDSCRKCGLCVAACPTEAFVSPRIMPKKVYDAVAAAAAAHETAYVTCTRALKRLPRENEVLLACVGDVTPETWFAILNDYPNVSVYLPLDVCTKCRNTTGEEMLGEAIATAEEWAGSGMGLEVEPSELKCVKRREFERKEFMQNIARSTGLTVSKLNPAAAAVTSVAQRLKQHANQITQLENTLAAATGNTTQRRRRILTQSRQLLLTSLQDNPDCAQNINVASVECDFAKCTLCGECVRACPTHACDLVGESRWQLEPQYCHGCGVCVDVCETKALRLVETDAAALVVPDPEAEKKAEEAKRAHEEAEKAKAEVKAKLNKALDKVEHLAD